MTLPGLPSLPEFWTASFGFWFFFVPVHVVLFGVLARLRGLPSALGISVGMAVGSLLAATLVEALLLWMFGPGAGEGASLAAHALREFAPWPIGVGIVCFAVAARTRRQEREFAEFVESLKTGL